MDLIKAVVETSIDDEKVKKIQELYEDEFPEFIKKMISFVDDVIFLENSYRLLSYDEILNAEDELKVEFGKQGVLPLIDCGENDFISYGTNDGSWFVFNIVDEIRFKERESLSELLK